VTPAPTQREIVRRTLEFHGIFGACVADFPPSVAYVARNRVSELRRAGLDIRSARCRVHRHAGSVARYTLVGP